MHLFHNDLDLPGVCSTQRKKLRKILPEPFTARQAHAANIAHGGGWHDTVRTYQALVISGKLPDVGLVWWIAGIAFRETPADLNLRHWADTLGPATWKEAARAANRAAARAAHAAARAAARAAWDAADWAADWTDWDAAEAAAWVADAAARSAEAAADVAAGWAAEAAEAAQAADAADSQPAAERVKHAILERIFQEVGE